MNIIFFTNICSHGSELLVAMKNHGIKISAIFIEEKTAQSEITKLKKKLKKGQYQEIFNVAAKRLISKFIPGQQNEWESVEYYKNFSEKIHLVENFNNKHTESLLSNLDPDIIILGGSRILRSNIIRIARVGILNAHPGLLPAYRGVNVIPWAIYHGDDIGVTVHFIDEGVDTGRICIQETIPVKAGDNFLSLGKKAEILAGKLMSQVVKKIIDDGSIDTIDNSKIEGKQFYKMDKKTRKIAEQRLGKKIKNENR